MIPKGGSDFWGFGLVEVMCKTVTVILNRRLGADITLHDVLHVYQANCGTRAVYLKAKLIQQLISMRDEFLYVLFLCLKKAYNSLDRDRCLSTLEVYGVVL